MAIARFRDGTATMLSRRHTTWRRLAEQVALLLVCCAVFGLATAAVHQYEAGIKRSSFTLRGQIPLPVLRFAPSHGALGVVAVVVHGYATDKEYMSSWGADLARQGVTTYTFDLPGHGASTMPYGGPAHPYISDLLVTSTGEMVDYALTHGPTAHPKLILIGYSLGTIAVGEYSLEHPQLTSLQATILVAGILTAQPTRTNPPNFLVLSGQFDLPGINEISRQLIASACGVPPAAVTPRYQCDTGGIGGHRQRIIMPGLDHISIVTASSTHNIALTWLGRYVDSQIGKVPVDADVRLHWLLLGFLAAGLAGVPLVSLGSALGGLRPWSTRAYVSAPTTDGTEQHELQNTDGIPVWQILSLLAGALGAGLVALHLILPPGFWDLPTFPFLAQQVSPDVATFLLISGLILLALLWSRGTLRAWLRRTEWPVAAKQMALAVIVTGLLYVMVSSLSSYAWEMMALSPARGWRAVFYVALIWPYVFAVKLLVESSQYKRGLRAILVEFATTALLVAALVVAIATNFVRLSYLGILFPIVILLLLWFVGFNAWVRHEVAHPVLLTATVETLALAWALAATLPLIG